MSVTFPHLGHIHRTEHALSFYLHDTAVARQLCAAMYQANVQAFYQTYPSKVQEFPAPEVYPHNTTSFPEAMDLAALRDELEQWYYNTYPRCAESLLSASDTALYERVLDALHLVSVATSRLSRTPHAHRIAVPGSHTLAVWVTYTPLCGYTVSTRPPRNLYGSDYALLGGHVLTPQHFEQPFKALSYVHETCARLLEDERQRQEEWGRLTALTRQCQETAAKVRAKASA